MAQSSPWRANDTVAYESMRAEAAELSRRLLHSIRVDNSAADEARNELIRVRRGAALVDPSQDTNTLADDRMNLDRDELLRREVSNMPSYQQFRRIELGRGDVVENIDSSYVKISDSWTQRGPADDQRPLIRNVHVKGLLLDHTALHCARLIDVTIDGLHVESISSFLFGNEFTRVTIKGDIKGRGLVFNTASSDDHLREEYTQALAAADQRPGWSLDISEARGQIDFRGYSAARIRRDPQTQKIAKVADFEEFAIEEFDWERTSFGINVREMLNYGWADVLLVANRLSPRFDEDMRVLDELESRGLVS